jgi:hypothetical protein
MNDFHLYIPHTLTAAVARDLQAAQASAGRSAEAWDLWATNLDELARSMPPLPAGLSVINHRGRTDTVTPDLVRDYRDQMATQLRVMRDRADAYAANVRRTFAQINDYATSSLCVLGQWSQQRYYPLIQGGGQFGDVFRVIDTGPDGDGFWLYESDESDDTSGEADWCEAIEDAAALAHQLNRNPKPFPETAPRGRFIPWRGRYTVQVVDRDEDLNGWRPIATVANWLEAVEQAGQYAAGTLKPPPLEPPDQEPLVAEDLPW